MMSHHRGLSPGGTLVACCLALGSSVALVAEHGRIPERRIRACVVRGQRRRRWVYPDPLEPWMHHLSALLDLLGLVRAWERGKARIEDVREAASDALAMGWGLEVAGRALRALRGAVAGVQAPPPLET